MNIAEALLALTQLIGVAEQVLSNLTLASKAIAAAHAEGRSELNETELAVLYNQDAAARYALQVAISQRSAIPVPTPPAQLGAANWISNQPAINLNPILQLQVGPPEGGPTEGGTV